MGSKYPNTEYIPHKTEKCSICHEPLSVLISSDSGKVLWEHGNNAEPINKGRCCQSCDIEVVIPTRMQFLLAEKRSKQALKDEHSKEEK